MTRRLSWARDLGFAFALGALSVLGFAPFHLFPLPILLLALLIGLWCGRGPAACARVGFAFGLGFFGFGVSWVFVSLHDYGHMPAALAAIATFLLCAMLALSPAAAGWLQAQLAVPLWVRAAALIPSLWMLTEWFRGWLLTGFPWLALGYPQAPPSPLAGFAPIVGVFGISLVSAISAGLAFLIFEAIRRRTGYAAPVPALNGPPRRTHLIVPALALTAIWLGGYLLKQIGWTQPTGEPLKVSLLQGNIPQDIKWAPENTRKSLDVYLTQALSTDARLIVLPETAFPLFYDQVPEHVLDTLRRHAQRNGGDILIGLPEYAPTAGERGGYFNSVFSLGASPTQVYRKVHLVPFGEFIPPAFGWVLNWLQIPLSDFSRGSIYQQPLKVAGQRVAVNICYEDVFGEEIIRQLPAATLLVNVSNVAWFGDSIAPWQHLQIAQMRALETGRYMLRATNTGMTAVVGPNGEVLAQAPKFSEAVLTHEAQGYTGTTPYVRFGNAIALAIALTLLAVACGTAATR